MTLKRIVASEGDDVIYEKIRQKLFDGIDELLDETRTKFYKKYGDTGSIFNDAALDVFEDFYNVYNNDW